jgi:hypothetical protein
MPLIEVTQIQRVTANVRFDAAIVTQINQYAAFIKATPDEVVNKGLEYLFAKDRDFAAFRNTEESQRVPELLRPRKAAPPNGSKPLPKKPAAVPEHSASVAGLKA